MERQYINWLKARIQPGSRVLVGIGDDAAVLHPTSAPLVLTTDALADGIHFHSAELAAEQIGYKALAVNLSDLAAMAADPAAAVVSLVLPKNARAHDARRITEGMLPLAAEFGISIAGGDTVVWDGALVISVAAVGFAPPNGVWRLDTAQPEDRLLVSGTLGGSIRKKHHSFQPRCGLAAFLRDRYRITAATDITDSLTLDLEKLAMASHCGAELLLSHVPVSPDATSLEEESPVPSALDRALYDGEDFELLLTARPEEAERILHDPDLPVSLTDIGMMTGCPGMIGCSADGSRQPIQPRGYEHKLS